MDNTPTRQQYLRSPFNNESWPVPVDADKAFIEAMILRGFVLVENEQVKPKGKRDA